jgi:hypothetical protein
MEQPHYFNLAVLGSIVPSAGNSTWQRFPPGIDRSAVFQFQTHAEQQKSFILGLEL